RLRDELAHARRERRPGADVRERLDRDAREGRDALAQRLGEVDLTAHRPLGDLGDLGARARVVGEELDDLLLDEGRVDVHDEEPDRAVGAARGGGGHRGAPRGGGGLGQGRARRGVAHDAGRGRAHATTVPLGTTVMPDSVTVNPRARSCSGSSPMRACSPTTTVLSMIARWICAWRCTWTPSMSTESETDDHECRYVPGESTEPTAVAPEMMTPGETIESAACPRRPRPACTNFAGGSPV